MVELDLKPVDQWQTIFLSTLLVHFCKLTTFLYFGLGAKMTSRQEYQLWAIGRSEREGVEGEERKHVE